MISLELVEEGVAPSDADEAVESLAIAGDDALDDDGVVVKDVINSKQVCTNFSKKVKHMHVVG